MDLCRTTRLTISHTNNEMMKSFAVNNNSVMRLDLKAGVRAVVIPVNK